MAALGTRSRVSSCVRLAPCPRADSPPRVSRGSSDDGERLPVGAHLALVLPLEEVLEQVAQELEGDVLECKRRAVEQLEDVLVRARAHERGDLGVSERRVGAVDELLEIGSWDLVCRDEERVQLECELREGQLGPVLLPVLRQGGERLWDVQPAVLGESSEDSLGTRWG